MSKPQAPSPDPMVMTAETALTGTSLMASMRVMLIMHMILMMLLHPACTQMLTKEKMYNVHGMASING